MIVFTQSQFFNYRRLIQVSGFDRNKLSWYPVLWNLIRQFCMWRLKIYWRFSVPKIINIGPDLLEIFENITRVRFFLRHSVVFWRQISSPRNNDMTFKFKVKYRYSRQKCGFQVQNRLSLGNGEWYGESYYRRLILYLYTAAAVWLARLCDTLNFSNLW